MTTVAAPADAAPAGEVPRAAAEACGIALEGFQSGGAYGVLAGCADLFPSCAVAWRALATPDAEVLAPFRACRDAYCPALVAPKPVLCDGRSIAEVGDGSELTELLTAMLVRDHRLDRDAARQLASVFVMPLAVNREVRLPPVTH